LDLRGPSFGLPPRALAGSDSGRKRRVTTTPQRLAAAAAKLGSEKRVIAMTGTTASTAATMPSKLNTAPIPGPKMNPRPKTAPSSPMTNSVPPGNVRV
jgi:hypothetical protein